MSIDPKVIDAEIAELGEHVRRQEREIDFALSAIHHSVGDKTHYVGRNRVWGLSDDEATTKARALEGVKPWDVDGCTRALNKMDAAQAAIEVADLRIRELHQVYLAHRWSRFFMVTDGHIHRSTACHTCRITTQFGWLPQLSGETEKEAVAAHGALLCTVCYPTAPVEWTNHYEKKAEEAAQARCSGSGKAPARQGQSPMRRYQPCSVCGTSQSVTSTGLIRAHKTPEGK